MSQQLIAQLETDGYDVSTATEIVKAAENKADDVATEFLEELLGPTPAIGRYIRGRGRKKPLSANRTATPLDRSQTATPVERRSTTPARSRASTPQFSAPKAQPYGIPLVPKRPGPPPKVQTPQPVKIEVSTEIKVESIKDLDAALRKLELSSTERVACNCMASRHGLFELAPNCLRCGRIVCAKEGLGPCFGCGEPLVDKSQIADIYEALQQQRASIVSTMGKKALKSHAISTDAVSREAFQANYEQAQANLQRLLGYQDSSAQRTKIIDQVADFETTDMGLNIWASPVEQARQLKEQQQRERKLEENRKSQRGRGRKVVSIDIQGNKVLENVEDATYEEEEEEEEDTGAI